MDEQIKKTIEYALHSYHGDDATRARLAFRGMSEQQMNEEHGQSGRTRREILDAHLAHEAKVAAALDWISSQ